jgi:hypothetical protein
MPQSRSLQQTEKLPAGQRTPANGERPTFNFQLSTSSSQNVSPSNQERFLKYCITDET